MADGLLIMRFKKVKTMWFKSDSVEPRKRIKKRYDRCAQIIIKIKIVVRGGIKMVD